MTSPAGYLLVKSSGPSPKNKTSTSFRPVDQIPRVERRRLWLIHLGHPRHKVDSNRIRVEWVIRSSIKGEQWRRNSSVHEDAFVRALGPIRLPEDRGTVATTLSTNLCESLNAGKKNRWTRDYFVFFLSFLNGKRWPRD